MPNLDRLSTVRVVPSFATDRTDSELLFAHVAGDRHAFDELFRRHRTQLYRLARGRTQAAEDADDAVQEAMLSAHRGALMQLPVGQRAAVVAIDMHGYSVAEAAGLLEVAEGTVKSRCSRARARLTALLGGPVPR